MQTKIPQCQNSSKIQLTNHRNRGNIHESSSYGIGTGSALNSGRVTLVL